MRLPESERPHPQRVWVTNARGARGHERGTTHVLVGHDVGDVLQDQLRPLAVLVQLLEEHTRLEIPSGDR